jgi:hypothetical protein
MKNLSLLTCENRTEQNRPEKNRGVTGAEQAAALLNRTQLILNRIEVSKQLYEPITKKPL